MAYAVGIMPATTVQQPSEAPLPPTPGSAGGRRAIRQRRNKKLPPVSVKALALQLPIDVWQQITWREGSNADLASRFARLRVCPAHRDAKRRQSAAEEWLLIEWPDGAAEPDHYWLSTLPADISFERLVDLTKLRWRIERDYLELKQEVGLDHYEGRGWRGFHHHASLCIAAYGFLVSETETIPPSGPSRAWCGPRSAVPAGYRPRGAAAALAAPCAELHCNSAHPPRTHPAARTAALSLLRTNAAAPHQAD
jgi:SRSO17 transposase